MRTDVCKFSGFSKIEYFALMSSYPFALRQVMLVMLNRAMQMFPTKFALP